MTAEESIDPKNETEEKGIEKKEGVQHFVTHLHPIASQVGDHVLSALQHDETVAVLTTITGSTHGQQVISIPLTAEHVQQVHAFIEEIHQSDEPEHVSCVGFHCFLDTEDSEED